MNFAYWYKRYARHYKIKICRPPWRNGLRGGEKCGSRVIAGFSLVLYRQIRVGDSICLNSPKGVVTAKVEAISLGFTVLRDELQHEVIVPNSIMMNSTVIRVGRAVK